jgi:serine/threonine protein kinase
VAVKVAKGTGKVGEWRKECNDMQQLRLDGCKAGGEAQRLAEMFLPTCLEVDQVGSVSYYVMQAAGTRGISDFAKKIKNDADTQKRVFAQTVAAVYSLHGIGWTHNDLHGHNIVLDSTDDVALIDFGEIKGHHRGLGNKHDANAVWRWAAVLADCPEGAQYPKLMKSFFSQKSKDELTARSKELLTCLQTKWKADQEFLTAFETVLTSAIKITEDQHIEELFNTKFIQQNLPPLKNVYPWDGKGKCSASGLDKKKQGAAPKAPARLPTGRPTKGDRVKVKTTGKCATIMKDDRDGVPYKVKYDNGEVQRMLLREVQVTWASECF